MIYLDNAATSWPKPPEVSREMVRFLEQLGGNPGRSGHQLSVDAGRVVYEARALAAELFDAPDPLRVIFTMNATHALNLALKGLLKPGDRVVTTGMEHNSVMRPLRALEMEGVDVMVAECSRDGELDFGAFRQALKQGARLVAINHASNVVGTIQDVAEAARVAHRAGALVLVDAAQTAGALPIDMRAMGVDLLAFSGHKGLLGPSGTGGLVISDGVDTSAMKPLMLGGTGSNSGRIEQPERLPDKFESGTPNSVGIAGLAAGVKFVVQRGVEHIRQQEMELAGQLIAGLSSVDGVRVYGARDPSRSTAVVSFTIDGVRVSEAGLRLQEEFGILCRVGMHCAPLAHQTMGTYPEGTVRFAPGIFTTAEEIDETIEAVRRIASP